MPVGLTTSNNSSILIRANRTSGITQLRSPSKFVCDQASTALKISTSGAQNEFRLRRSFTDSYKEYS